MDQRRRWQRWQHPELPKVFQLPIVYSCILQPWLGAATKLPRRNCHCYDPMKRTSKVAANAFCDNRGDNDNGEEHVAERATCLGSFVSVATNFISCKPVTPLMSATPASFTNGLSPSGRLRCGLTRQLVHEPPRACLRLRTRSPARAITAQYSPRSAGFPWRPTGLRAWRTSNKRRNLFQALAETYSLAVTDRQAP